MYFGPFWLSVHNACQAAEDGSDPGGVGTTMALHAGRSDKFLSFAS